MKPIMQASQAGKFRIWDYPTEEGKYVAGIDVAEGKVRDRSMAAKKAMYSYSDDRPDFSAIVVLDIETFDHVATWHGWIEATELYQIAAALGLYYNEALLVPEINGPGLVVVEGLQKHIAYPNMYRSKLFNRVDSDPLGSEWGWRTTVTTRPLLIARVEEAVASGQQFTRDPRLVKELRTMEYDEAGVARGRRSNKDDLVIALGLALQGRYESLYGSLEKPPEENKRLDGFERMVWKRWEEKGKLHDRVRNHPVRRPFDGRRRGGPGLRRLGP